MNFEECKKVFEEFINNYDLNNEKINLKYLHTFRVVDFSEKIAKSLGLSNEDIEIAKVIGLLHDIGRFEQIKIYDTYDDSISVNHAHLGVEILKKDNYIDNYIKDEENKKIVLKTILEHNKLKIEDNLDRRTEMFCKLIRDADKLDILEMFTKKIFIIENNNEKISPKVLASALSKKSVNNKDIITKMDYYINKISLVFDLNYPYSKQYVHDNEMITFIIDELIKKKEQEKDNLLLIKNIVITYLSNKEV